MNDQDIAKIQNIIKEMNEFADKHLALSTSGYGKFGCMKLEIAELKESRAKTNADYARMKQALGVAIAGLETLSRLGNGAIPGNSIGNKIARQTMELIHEIFEPKDETEQPGGGGL